MQQLELLEIEDGRISDISVLAKLSSIMTVRLPGNDIVDVSPLRHDVKLVNLDLSRNRISDVGALTGLPQLKRINVSGNRITDIGPLVEHYRRLVEAGPVGKLSRRTWQLNVRGNPITNAELLDKPWMRNVHVDGP
jgi:Leucine-rich repeat (LRR) protein